MNERTAFEFFHRFEQMIRQVARRRLRDRRLQDSADLCQSVFASFFVRAAAGQFVLNTLEQSRRLLMTIAKRKLINLEKKRTALRRGGGCVPVPYPHDGVVDPGPPPSETAARNELVERALAHLSPEEQRIAELHHARYTWPEIAARLG